ncbi:Alpha/Beta hydrolase protein [Aspergillus avenaceus]|uniref:Alpha/Beta hydrolase protein n=1 Tax=Aspergillus avenaceus TaxID=36643 RepID=A0A5N6TKU1_ASPAV|nr:Alpha/Beta hydrolase protein [Aspergillus avenaceus]
MSSQIPRPPLNPELEHVHKALPHVGISTKEELEAYRQFLGNFTLDTIFQGKEDAISYEETDIPGPAGPMKTTIFRPKHQTLSAEETPGILHIHGGGLTTGNRFMGLTMLNWVEALGATIITAEYRLAPEHPQPAALEDSYAALQWMSENASKLGFNPNKLIITGGSAGGTLAAGLSLLARDRSGPKICGQLLSYPWVNDRAQTLSRKQFADLLPWVETNTIHTSRYALGENGEYATMYSVPATATDFSGLPPTFIDVGEADSFRDEDINFASALWKAGVPTEFHVWPGCWHGFDMFVPDAPVSRQAAATRLEWLRKLVSRS